MEFIMFITLSIRHCMIFAITYCQYMEAYPNNTNNAVDNTFRNILANSGGVVRSEYSAENNNKGAAMDIPGQVLRGLAFMTLFVPMVSQTGTAEACASGERYDGLQALW
jgi:hypothetical protein